MWPRVEGPGSAGVFFLGSIAVNMLQGPSVIHEHCNYFGQQTNRPERRVMSDPVLSETYGSLVRT